MRRREAGDGQRLNCRLPRRPLKASTIESSSLLRRRALAGTLTAALVAVAYAALAFANGGYSGELIAAVTVAIWWVVIVLVATRLAPAYAVPRAAVLAGAFLAAFAGLTALSMIWADDAGRAFTEVVRWIGYLGLFALVVVVSGRTGPRPWLLGLTAGLVIVTVASLASRFDPSLFGGADRSIFEAIPFAHGRLSYPIGYWNGLAACLALGIALLAWLGTQAPTRLGRAGAIGLLPAFGLALYLTSSRGGVVAIAVAIVVLLGLGPARIRLLGGLLLGAAGSAILTAGASQSDALVAGLTTDAAYAQGRAMAAATVACVLVVGAIRYAADDWLGRLQPSRPTVRRVLMLAAVAVIAAVIASDPVARVREFSSPNDVGSSPSIGTGHLTASSGTGRSQFWGQALDAFASKPLVGLGAGNYELWWNSHAPNAVLTRTAHSLPLQVLAELGVVGIVLLAGFLVVAGISGWRRLRPRGRAVERDDAVVVALAVGAAGLASTMIDWTWQIPAAFAPVIGVAALLTGSATARAPAPGMASAASEAYGRLQRQRARAAQFGLGVATILFAWVAVWVAGDQLVATLKLGDSHDAVAHGDLGAAAQNARDAAVLQPWSPEPQLQLALIDQRLGDLRGARDAVEKAIDRASGDWRPWLVRAQIAAASGNRTEARNDLAVADFLSPTRFHGALRSAG